MREIKFRGKALLTTMPEPLKDSQIAKQGAPCFCFEHVTGLPLLQSEATKRIERIERIMKTAAYIIMLALCAGIVVMNYKLNGQLRKEQVYNTKKGLVSALIIAVLVSLIYWL